MMEEQRRPANPVTGLILIALIIGIIVGSIAIWQSIRWWFEHPLALEFHESDTELTGATVQGPEVRRFIAMEVLEAGRHAEAAGFDCKGYKFTRQAAVCYRELWVGICRELWSIDMNFDENKKVSRVQARKRRTCYVGS